MDHLHSRVQVNAVQQIRVVIDVAANVLVLDDYNYQQYRYGQAYTYYGGFYNTSPVFIKPPNAGPWNVVINLGGVQGSVQAGVAVV